MFVTAHNISVAFNEQQINHNALCSNICCYMGNLDCQCAVDTLHGRLMHSL